MNLIAAVDRQWNIGKDNKLLARIPADQAFFRDMTSGRVVIMGRKTLESLPGKRPLPDRTNIVISGREDYEVDGALVVHTVEDAVSIVSQLNSEDVFVIGGGMIYRAFLPYCDTAYITKIDYAYDADTSFPNLDMNTEWELVSKGEEQTCFDLVYEFDVYRRRG